MLTMPQHGVSMMMSVRKTLGLLEKPFFELAAKGVFRLGRCYIFWRGVLGLWASNRESTDTDG